MVQIKEVVPKSILNLGENNPKVICDWLTEFGSGGQLNFVARIEQNEGVVNCDSLDGSIVVDKKTGKIEVFDMSELGGHPALESAIVVQG